MRSPLDAFRDWLDALPPELRKEVAILIAGMPGADLQVDDLDGIDRILTARLDGCAGSAILAVGMALSLRALIEFYIVRKRGTQENWKAIEEQQRYVLARLKQLGMPPDQQCQFQQSLDRMPLRGKQWIAAIERWKRLATSDLSDENLDKWIAFCRSNPS